MSAENWREALAQVDAFVAAHPEIEVSATGLHVPRGHREAFYELLRQARAALAEQAIPQTGEAEAAVAHLHDALARLREATGAAVELPDELAAFCDDVRLGASQTFVSRLLSYVQGVLSADELERAAASELPPQFELLAMAAYETWMCYALVLALRPRTAYLADTFDQQRIVCTRTDTLPVGRQKYSPVLRLPEAVFACEDGSVWALKFELASELDFYGSKPLRRRDFSAGGDTRGSLGRRLALLYRVDSLDAVPFVANRDTRSVFPPTLMAGALWPRDFGGSLYGRAAFQRIITLNPRSGALLLACDGSADAARETAASYGAQATVVDGAYDPSLFDSFTTTR